MAPTAAVGPSVDKKQQLYEYEVPEAERGLLDAVGEFGLDELLHRFLKLSRDGGMMGSPQWRHAKDVSAEEERKFAERDRACFVDPFNRNLSVSYAQVASSIRKLDARLEELLGGKGGGQKKKVGLIFGRGGRFGFVEAMSWCDVMGV